MQPTATIDSSVQTNLVPAEKIQMSIDQAATAHLMSVLTNLYSDPLSAIIREYSTNAWDAHISVGNTQPIEVTTPNRMSPYFVVRDFGPGMDVDDLHNVYSRYGASSKRDDNTQNGMLGLGSKSALTYTSQFLIESVKNGKKHLISVSLNEVGIPEMNVISVEPTTDHSGVIIQIPAKRSDDFATAVNNFFRFWKPGTVLVNGQTPRYIKDSAEIVIDDNLFSVPGNKCDYVVFSNVAYPVKDEYSFWSQDGYLREFGVVLFVDAKPGETPKIAHTPNREALFYTKATIATIEEGRERFQNGMFDVIKKRVEDSESGYQAFLAKQEWDNKYRGLTIPDLTYKGKAIPKYIQSPVRNIPALDSTGVQKIDPISNNPISINVSDIWYFANGDTTSKSTTTGTTLTGRQAQWTPKGFLIVTDYPFDSAPSNSFMKKLRYYRSQNGLTDLTAVIVKDHPDSFWLDTSPVVTHDQIKNIKVPPAIGQSAPKSKPVLHRFQTLRSNGEFDTHILDFSKITKVLYVSPMHFGNSKERMEGRNVRRLRGIYKVLEPLNFTLIVLGANRFDKFRRDYSNVQPFAEAGPDIIKAYESSLTADDKTAIGYSYHDWEMAKTLYKHSLDIDDPDVVALIKLVETTAAQDARNRRDDMESFATYMYTSLTSVDKIESPFYKYKLLNSSIGNDPKHIEIYMNAVYAAKV